MKFLELDGVAAVNLEEPSEGDLKRVVDAYREERDKHKNLKEKVIKILDFCETHIDIMWSAKIISIILDCDFRDSKEELKKFKKGLK